MATATIDVSSETAAERIRLIVDTSEQLRRAVRIAAARAGKSVSELMNDLIRKSLPDAIREAGEAIKEQRKRSDRN